ncbi:hypothetical protein CO651_15390 [Rhizobium phaseoli]|nr:hypothetical protein CO648_02035 [Rhizobium phaseoli]PDS71034.1 hypothetical protein CO651_15390 [Rhizobium phaseoli]
MSFEASPCGLRTFRMRDVGGCRAEAQAGERRQPMDEVRRGRRGSLSSCKPTKPQYPSDRSQIARSRLGKISNRALGCAPRT